MFKSVNACHNRFKNIVPPPGSRPAWRWRPPCRPRSRRRCRPASSATSCQRSRCSPRRPAGRSGRWSSRFSATRKESPSRRPLTSGQSRTIAWRRTRVFRATALMGCRSAVWGKLSNVHRLLQIAALTRSKLQGTESVVRPSLMGGAKLNVNTIASKYHYL